MTFLGKLFVMVNVALSLTLAFVAFGLYANSVDWGYDPAKPGQPGGVLKEKQDEIKQLQPVQYPAENTWRQARQKLLASEQYRRDDRAFYAAEFEHLRTKATKDNPARQVVYDKLRPKRDPKAPSRPLMEPAKDRADKDLLSRAIYDNELRTAQKDNLALLDELDGLIKEDIEETRKMLDLPGRRLPDGPDPRGVKGLRTLLQEERMKREGIEAEQRLVRPLFVNVAIESELVFQRIEAMEERIKELQNYIKKRKLDAKLTKR
jgi:hypothetical protein